MPSALTHIESLLRARKLDRTLASSCSPHQLSVEPLAIGVKLLDEQLYGGLPRGEFSEIVGVQTSGRTTLALRSLAAATQRGELVALVDAFDRFDVSSAVAAQLDLDRTLWVRGRVTSYAGPHRDTNALRDVLKATGLVLQARICDLVVIDLADAPVRMMRGCPLTTWLRLHRMIEGSRTACVLLSQTHVWRSAGGLSVEMTADGWRDDAARPLSWARLFEGLTVRARLARARVSGDATPSLPVPAVCA